MIKFLNSDIKKIYYQGRMIKAVYYRGQKIFPDIYGSVYFGPTCYWNIGGSLESIVMSMEGGYIRVDVNGAWFFVCQPVFEPTLDNPCIGVSDNGDAYRKYDLFFSQSKQCWVWNDITLDDGVENKFRYISLSEADARENKPINLAGLKV